MDDRLTTLLERPGDLTPDMGPESMAILDTLQAALHARMSQEATGVPVESLCDGDSPPAVVLRAFRDASSVLEFSRAAAAELLPIGAGPLMLSGGLKRGMLERFDKVLQKKQVADTAAIEVRKKRDELHTLKDEMRKTLCMAMCRTKTSTYGPSTEEGTCGGSKYGERCGHLVATLNSDGDVVPSKAGIHIDTKRAQKQKTVWKKITSSYSWFKQNVSSVNPFSSEKGGVGAWADGYLVKGWRTIDNGWIHLCPYHEEEIRRSNPAYWAYLVASTAMKFVVASQLKTYITTYIGERLVADIAGNKKELTEADVARINNILKDFPGVGKREGILAKYKNLTYKGSTTPIVFKNGLLLGSAKASSVREAMDREHRRLAYDSDGMTEADKITLANKYKEYGNLRENKVITAASTEYTKAMKDGRITSLEHENIRKYDPDARTSIQKGLENNAKWNEAMQDGYLTTEEEAMLRRRGVRGKDLERAVRDSKNISERVEKAASDFNISHEERRENKLFIFGDKDRSAAFAAARKESPMWQAAEIVTRLKNGEQKYVTEEEQKHIRKMIRENPERAKAIKTTLSNYGKGKLLTQEGLPMTEKQSKMIDLAKSSMKGEKVVTPTEMKELQEKIPADQWSVLGIDSIVKDGVNKYASDVERLHKEAEDGMLRRGDVRNAWLKSNNVADETIEHVMKDAASVSASQTSKDIRDAMENASIIDGAAFKGSVSESDQQKLLKRVKNKKDIVKQMGEDRVTAEGVPMTPKQIKLVKKIEAVSSDGVVTPDEYEKLRKNISAQEWASVNAEDRLTKGLREFQSQAEKIQSALETSGGVIRPDQLKGVSRETMEYMQKNAKSVSADPLSKRLAVAMRSGNILREAGRKGYVADADQKRLQAMDPEDLKRYAKTNNIVLNRDGTALNKKQYKARKVLLDATKDGVINPVEAKRLLKKRKTLNQLNKEDTARLEKSKDNYYELERKVEEEGVLDQNQIITLEDGTRLKASEALKQVSLTKDKGVKRVLETQRQVDKLEKGKIQSLDSDTLEHLRTTKRGRNIEATIVRDNPELPAFRSRRTSRKGTLMTKKEAKLADAMRKNIVDLTSLQDVQKIKAAASLTEWRALDKVRAKYASQLKTVKKFEEMAGSREAYDEMRAEVEAVGAGREDPLTSEFLNERLKEIKQKMDYYDTHRFANIASPKERGSLAFEGMGELGFDAANQTREAAAASYEWATRRKGDAAEFDVLQDTLEGGAWEEGQCVVCFRKKDVKHGLCADHRKYAKKHSRGRCFACGEPCNPPKYMHEECEHQPASISYNKAKKKNKKRKAVAVAAREASSSSSSASNAASKNSSASSAVSKSTAAADKELSNSRHRCNICWGAQLPLVKVTGELWYHHSCLQKWEEDWARVREGEPLPRRSIPRGYVPKRRLPRLHTKDKRESEHHKKQRELLEKLRAREEAFIPMTYAEYEGVHKAKCASATNHHILTDWTSHNDVYRLKTYRRRDEDGPMHQRDTITGPIPVGILTEEPELRVQVTEDGQRYAIYNPHFLRLDGLPLTEDDFNRLIQYMQTHTMSDRDSNVNIDGKPLAFLHATGLLHATGPEPVTEDELLGNPKNVLESEIRKYVHRRGWSIVAPSMISKRKAVPFEENSTSKRRKVDVIDLTSDHEISESEISPVQKRRKGSSAAAASASSNASIQPTKLRSREDNGVYALGNSVIKIMKKRDHNIFLDSDFLTMIQGKNIIPTVVCVTTKHIVTIQPRGMPVTKELIDSVSFDWRSQKSLLTDFRRNRFFYADIKPDNFVYFARSMSWTPPKPEEISSHFPGLKECTYDRQTYMIQEGLYLIDIDSFRRVDHAGGFYISMERNQPMLRIADGTAGGKRVLTSTYWFERAFEIAMRCNQRFANQMRDSAYPPTKRIQTKNFLGALQWDAHSSHTNRFLNVQKGFDVWDNMVEVMLRNALEARPFDLQKILEPDAELVSRNKTNTAAYDLGESFISDVSSTEVSSDDSESD